MRATCLFLLLPMLSCSAGDEWKFVRQIQLPGVSPLGIVIQDGGFLVSDPDHNRVLRVDEHGSIEAEWADLQRPMHLSLSGTKVYIPEFLNDSIKFLEEEKIKNLPLETTFDAPAAVAQEGNTLAVADFFNHRVVISRDGVLNSIGVKGHADGQLHYPTDLVLRHPYIFVADAYNHRVQIFDQGGSVHKVVGWNENIRVASGLEVSADRIFITDFFGNRVLIYDHQGKLMAVLGDSLEGPTDVLVDGKAMFVANYKGGYITEYRR